MKKILFIIMFFIFFSPHSFGEETVWDVKNADFWTEIEQDNSIFEKEKNLKLEAEINLEFNEQPQEIDLIDLSLIAYSDILHIKLRNIKNNIRIGNSEINCPNFCLILDIHLF